MYCTKCGTELQKGVSFCTDCGSKVGNAPVSAASEALDESTKPARAEGTGETTNNLATLSLVLGITSVFFFEFVILPLVAVITSSISLGKANELSRNGVLKTGKGKSVAGLVLGAIYSLLGFYYLLLW